MYKKFDLEVDEILEIRRTIESRIEELKDAIKLFDDNDNVKEILKDDLQSCINIYNKIEL